MTPTRQNEEDIVSSWKVISMKCVFYVLFKLMLVPLMFNMQ